MLDFGDEFDHGGRAVEDADGRFDTVLDEPLAVRGQNRRVHKLVADQDVRPGGCLGAGRERRVVLAGVDGESSIAGRRPGTSPDHRVRGNGTAA
ncbi:hypothetical protein GCM10010344_70520 [Streptomyces bluensis]|nr:hypothetical protein GCM10010344_70520 [Streptomyces bluensis]